jgi:hypothetical protein
VVSLRPGAGSIRRVGEILAQVEIEIPALQRVEGGPTTEVRKFHVRNCPIGLDITQYSTCSVAVWLAESGCSSYCQGG